VKIKLKEIDLSKGEKGFHPDIKTSYPKTQYLLLVRDSYLIEDEPEFLAGTFHATTKNLLRFDVGRGDEVFYAHPMQKSTATPIDSIEEENMDTIVSIWEIIFSGER